MQLYDTDNSHNQGWIHNNAINYFQFLYKIIRYITKKKSLNRRY